MSDVAVAVAIGLVAGFMGGVIARLFINSRKRKKWWQRKYRDLAQEEQPWWERSKG